MEEDDGFKTYSLEEVAAMIAPSDDPAAVVRWLMKQIRAGDASAYKVMRNWRMTHEDVESLIGRNRNTQTDSESSASSRKRRPLDSPWRTAVEAAEHANVSAATIRDAVKQGELPAYAVGRSGRQYRLRVQDVDDWMMSRAWEPEWARPQNL